MTRGYVLIEAAISYVILTLALVALVPSFILGLKANKTSEKVQTAALLSVQLLEEIRMRK
jgi:Tfp pilus assembly protein PilV